MPSILYFVFGFHVKLPTWPWKINRKSSNVEYFIDRGLWLMWYIFVFPQEGRATVNQDTRLDNRVIDLRVSCFPELRDKQECMCPECLSQYIYFSNGNEGWCRHPKGWKVNKFRHMLHHLLEEAVAAQIFTLKIRLLFLCISNDRAPNTKWNILHSTLLCRNKKLA